ncbi:MAG: cadherin domain-containing protein, partial [bacterium]|nr:cadherin domain-containing protein [bacterium]
APATAPCSNGVTVPNPTTNTGLVQDCAALLEARDALAGPGRLNWDDTVALSSWTGVTVSGTPQRVTGLRLGAQGLAGPLPAALGRLTHLTALDLRGNALTGDVPEALGTLTRLTELWLAGTRLTGCLPAALAGVATTDAALQGLAACQAGPAFGAPRYDWIVPAGLPAGAAVGQVQATDPDGGAVSYAITAGNDAGVFQLNATTGILSVAGTLPAGGASLEVTASDAQGGMTRVPVAVGVADAAQQRAPPLFPAAGWSFRVAEDAAVGTVVGTAAARDLDGGPLTYALTAGTTGGALALDTSSGALTVAGALDHATTPSYTLTLTATDAHAGTATTTVTVTVTDVPPQPMFAESGYSFTVAEDTAVATQVATIRAAVAGGAAVTHTLTAGNTGGAWTLDATTGELKVAEPLDHETAPTYQLMVEARSGPAAATVVPVTLTVTDVDEPPVFDAERYAFSVAEDAIVTTTPGTVTAVDPEGDTILYTITAGNTGGPWALDALAGRLVLNGRLDYETTPAYTLTVHADVLGSSRLTATTTVTVTVTDVADAPPVPTNLAATPAATSLGLTWDAVPGATKYQVDYRVAETETWTTAANDVTTAAATLAELTCATAYEVQVRAYGSGAGYTNVWSAPSETLAATTATCPPPAFGAETYAFSVAENSDTGTAVGAITATTTGAGAVTYVITAGNDAGAFALDAGTGALTVAGTLDHETTPRVSLTVEARAGGSQATVTATVTVTDVDEAPAFGTAEYEFSVAEDAAVDAAVGSVSATDPEDGDLTYAITEGNEGDAFAIDAGTGALTVAATLDYETTDEYHLTVTASDAGHTATVDVAIAVTDVAFPPVFAEASYAFSVAEDAAGGAALGTVSATDPEGGTVTYAITAGNDAGGFAIDAGTGALAVAGVLDYETTSSYSLTVEAKSGGGAVTATATVPVTITVTNVDEAPAFDAASYAFSVAEDAALGATIGTVTATDPEGGTVVYDITAGNAALTWAVDSLKGAVVVGARLIQAATPSYRLTVRAGSLAGGPSATTTVTITVTSAG